MWQAVMDVLPDLKVGTIEIRDLVNLLIGGLGAYLAYLAIKMGQEQGRIAKRQAEIAETQHRIMQEQLAKTARLSFEIWRNTDDSSPYDFILSIVNLGNKSANHVSYRLAFPMFVADQIDIQFSNTTPEKKLLGDTDVMAAGETFSDPIHALSRMFVARFSVPRPTALPIYFQWVIESGEGRFPEGEVGMSKTALELPKQPRGMATTIRATSQPEERTPFSARLPDHSVGDETSSS